jgi:MoaA/NifB/PqqE/SkfB family radical SAM enzyme
LQPTGPCMNADAHLPLDHPSLRGPYRIYFALTNHCNRACPWCSTCASPSGNTWLSLDDYRKYFPADGEFEIQLEGGEPTVHPRFAEFVRIAKAHPRCTRTVVCTNGVLLPRDASGLKDWLDGLGDAFTLKLSINHHLLEHDRGLLELARTAHRLIDAADRDRSLVINVRLRKSAAHEDKWVVHAVKEAGLESVSNIFYLQRYGYASQEMGWEPPFLADMKFTLVNPDGQAFGQDLIARSEAMRNFP